MELPLQITFRNMEISHAVEASIRDRAGRLGRFSPHITACRVIVETPHRHHNQGKLYHVRIELSVPGNHLAVSREPALHHAHEDVFVAIRDSFDAAARQLEDYEHRRRGQMKLHVGPPRGRIARLIPGQDHGFIETPDGRTIYFHRHAVLKDGFEGLAVGDDVQFVEEPGEKGPQASTVRVSGAARHGGQEPVQSEPA